MLISLVLVAFRLQATQKRTHSAHRYFLCVSLSFTSYSLTQKQQYVYIRYFVIHFENEKFSAFFVLLGCVRCFVLFVFV